MAAMLRGIRVIEFAGLAPVPFSGLHLSDFGAEVIRIDKSGSDYTIDRMGGGKKSIALNLKDKKAVSIVRDLVKTSDVVLEPFRPGVMERLGLGPEVLCKDNPALIFARLSGYGQKGPLADVAGHDINYISYAGTLSLLGRAKDRPYAPGNFIADFAGGSMMCTMGILLALINRANTGKGEIIDAAMVDGAAYFSTFAHTARTMAIWSNPRGMNILDSGSPFYDVYETNDHKFMGVGSIEPQFYAALIKGLGLEKEALPDQMDFKKWGVLRKTFETKFSEKTQKEWTEIFTKSEYQDACVSPVLSIKEWQNHKNTIERKTSRTLTTLTGEEATIPSPAPRFMSQAPIDHAIKEPQLGEHTHFVLEEILKYDKDKIEKLFSEKIVTGSSK